MIAIELETAFHWFGLVETGAVGTGAKRTLVMRLSDLGRSASQRPDVGPEDDARLPGADGQRVDDVQFALVAGDLTTGEPGG